MVGKGSQPPQWTLMSSPSAIMESAWLLMDIVRAGLILCVPAGQMVAFMITNGPPRLRQVVAVSLEQLQCGHFFMRGAPATGSITLCAISAHRGDGPRRERLSASSNAAT